MNPSAYLLVLRNPGTARRTVGRLGVVRFEPGYYVYVGSGGPNVLKRFRRHMRPQKPRRWHIDYLTAGPRRMRTVDAWLLPGKLECALAETLGRDLPGVRGFGASDCRCSSHLFHAPDFSRLERALRSCGQ